MDRWESRQPSLHRWRRPGVQASLWLALVLWLTLAPPALALSAVNRSFEEMVELADQILVGTVSRQESLWRDPVQQRGIVTRITLTDLDLLKGEHGAADFVLEVAGGQIGPYGEAIAGLPQLISGQRYVLFIRGNARSLFPVVGIHQGVLVVRSVPGDEPRVYTYGGQPLTGIEQIESPAKGLANAPALPLDALRGAVRALTQGQSDARP